MENEIWKDVPGYDGYYQVSNYGHVKSLSRQIVVRGNTRLLHNDRFIKISKHNKSIGVIAYNTITNEKKDMVP